MTLNTNDLKPKTWYTINNKLSYVSNITKDYISIIEYDNNELRYRDLLSSEKLSIQAVEIPMFDVGDYVLIINIPDSIFGSRHISARMKHLKNKVLEIVEIDEFMHNYIVEDNGLNYAITPFDLFKIEL